jgi:hypothetical protein
MLHGEPIIKICNAKQARQIYKKIRILINVLYVNKKEFCVSSFRSTKVICQSVTSIIVKKPNGLTLTNMPMKCAANSARKDVLLCDSFRETFVM